MKNAIIAGIKQFTPYLADDLADKGYQVTLIDLDPLKGRAMEERYSYRVVEGDASDHSVLKEANILRCETLLALTGSDATNLVICKTAQMDFHVQKTLAWINNPFNEEVFKSLGVTRCLNIVPTIVAEMNEALESKNVHAYLKTARVQSLVEKLYRKAHLLKSRNMQDTVEKAAMREKAEGYREAAKLLEDSLNFKVFVPRD